MEDLWIILVDYNGADDTLECIRSILDTNYSLNIIVVKNSQDIDNSKKLDVMRGYITILENNINGFSAGNNMGIKYALSRGANYVLLLNNDTVIDKTFLEKMYEQRTSRKALTGVMNFYDNKNKIALFKGSINRFTGNTIFLCKNNKKKQTFISGACMFLSKEIINEVGFLDEDYFMYCEDTDYCIRLLEKNIDLITVPDAKYWHKIGHSTRNDSTFSNYYVTRNRLLNIKKHKGYFMPTAIPFTIITRIFRAMIMSFRKPSLAKSYIKGIKDGLSDICGEVEKTY